MLVQVTQHGLDVPSSHIDKQYQITGTTYDPKQAG